MLLRVVLLLVGVLSVKGLGGLGSKWNRLSFASFKTPYDGVSNVIKEGIERLELMYTTEDFVRKYGYPFETHTVTTEDGYLLAVHRIPGSPKAATSGAKGPVFLMHGIAAASDCWVLTGPKISLGFLLADEGYDVWMGNARGNTYSRKHAFLSPNDLTFNDFTWHEMGVYDLPAMIDYILKVTNQPQLFYIGHSMGTTMFFVLTSTRPEYNQKIRLGVTMAPAVFLMKTTSSFRLVMPLIRKLVKGSTVSRLSSLTSPTTLPQARLIKATCSEGKPYQSVCKAVYSSIFGSNDAELNTTILPTIVAHGISWYNVQLVDHFVQAITTGRFETYARKTRNAAVPTEYDLSKITVPVSLHYALNDLAVRPEGVVQLSKILPNVVNMALVTDVNANHNVFVFAIHARQLVYNDLLKLMEKY